MKRPALIIQLLFSLLCPLSPAFSSTQAREPFIEFGAGDHGWIYCSYTAPLDSKESGPLKFSVILRNSEFGFTGVTLHRPGKRHEPETGYLRLVAPGADPVLEVRLSQITNQEKPLPQEMVSKILRALTQTNPLFIEIDDPEGTWNAQAMPIFEDTVARAQFDSCLRGMKDIEDGYSGKFESLQR